MPDNIAYIISKINAGIQRDQACIDNEIVQQEGVSTSKAPDQDCTHHWKIETPAGETSMGICAHCGGTKPFSNSLVISQRYRYGGKLGILRTSMPSILFKTNEPDIDEDFDNGALD